MSDVFLLELGVQDGGFMCMMLGVVSARPQICWYACMCGRMYRQVVAVEALSGLYKRCRSFYGSRCRVKMVEGKKGREKKRKEEKAWGGVFIEQI